MKKILTLFLSLLLCTNVFAGPIKEFVVIGDSLSDNGNLYNSLFKLIPKSPPYFEGRFSNGPTWAEDAGQYYFENFGVSYKIDAYGGATAIMHDRKYDKFIAPTILEWEVYKYLFESRFQDQSNVLFALWIGANDYLYDQQEDTSALVNSVVDKISWGIQTLINNGAKQIVVLNLPDMSRTPFAKTQGTGERLHLLSALHNQRLAEAVAVLQKNNPNVKLLQIDIFSIFNDLLDNVDQFNKKFNINITDITNACWTGGMTLKNIQKDKLNIDLKNAFLQQHQTNHNFDSSNMSQFIMNSPALSLAYALGQSNTEPCDNPTQHVFWDELHPTATVHEVLAKIFVQTVPTSIFKG